MGWTREKDKRVDTAGSVYRGRVIQAGEGKEEGEATPSSHSIPHTA